MAEKTFGPRNETFEQLTKRMTTAWSLVAPLRHWKDPVVGLVTKQMLATLGLTIEDVKEAVSFYTATEATVMECLVAPGYQPGYRVTADGYFMGPAGP